MTTQRQADAGTSPCQMRTSHNPTPIRTQRHHRYPSFLQKRLWGEVRLDDRWDLCGTDHDSVHAWLGWLLGDQVKPRLDPGLFVKREAEAVMAWYEKERTALTPTSAGYGVGGFGSGAYGGGGGTGGVLAEPDAQWDGLE